MSLSIYHNRRCSKSRKTLEMLESRGASPTVIEYLESPPDAATILRLADMLGLPVSGLLRTGEAEFREATDLPPLEDDEALAGWIARHPGVLQRPIVVDDASGRAVIGRPPENVSELLQS